MDHDWLMRESCVAHFAGRAPAHTSCGALVALSASGATGHAQSRAARGAHEAIDAAVARLGEDLGEDAERVKGLLERADRLDLLLELGE